ncbi:MAG: hypothetical protein QOF44_5181, partial [Streptomyces sp.]|nr:hypothetical protein [Streptomyces sp.]
GRARSGPHRAGGSSAKLVVELAAVNQAAGQATRSRQRTRDSRRRDSANRRPQPERRDFAEQPKDSRGLGGRPGPDSQATAEIKVDLSLRADVLPEQGGRTAPVGRAHHVGPFRFGQHMLEHQGVCLPARDSSRFGWLRSRPVIERDGQDRDLKWLVVPRVGSLTETGDVWEPYRLLDPADEVVAPVAVFMRDLQAIGRPATTQRLQRACMTCENANYPALGKPHALAAPARETARTARAGSRRRFSWPGFRCR